MRLDDSLDKQFLSGILFKFVCAPPRWKGEEPRKPEGLFDKVGTVLAGPFEDTHKWGGIFDVLVEGKIFKYWGDFMEEVISESR